MRKPLTLVLVLVAAVVLASSAWRESIAQPGKAADKGTGVAAVYQKHCAKCHLDNGKGLESLQPPDFTSEKWQKENTNAAIAKGIREGKETMPGFKDTLSAAQITALVRHIRAFGPKAAKPAKK
jgi:mono/diheme cytochrome c family protein